MTGEFERAGVRFAYPENWECVPDDYESGWAVTVYSPDTAFLSVTYDAGVDDPNELADAALSTLRGEYPQLDSEPAGGTIARSPAVGYDVQFIALDLTNTCLIRAIPVSGGTLLVYWQACDTESQNQLVLRAICQSLTLADDD
ncbi:MAG: hypothetical protein K1X57_02235 [Gemmataceae bacterium]|nr:hypothetical protein [Gemmataceae bacterium]